MNLSSELISQFVKVTKDDKKVDNGSTVYGTIVMYNGSRCVKLDGSDQITPITTTTDAIEGDRVAVLIKNHTATVTGNITSPSARKEDVDDIGDSVKEHGDRLDEFENIVADTVTTDQLSAVQANIENLYAKKAEVSELEARVADINELTAKKADIEYLEANYVTTENLETNYATIEHLEAEYATIENLNATNGKFNTLESTFATFEQTTTNKLNAQEADIKDLETDKLSTKEADIKYANIDFGNITEAAVTKIFSDSGIIKDLIVSEGTITGELVGVTIKGDLIEAGTLKADKLVVKGSDGIYYKLNIEAGATTSEEVTEEELQNGLHGTAIIAKTITAEKIAVDDLVAFDATIGGFKITKSSIYSGVKSSSDNTTRGIYLDNEGQVAFGDSDNYLKYYKDEDGTYKLAISAGSIVLSTSNKTIEEVIAESTESIQIGGRNLFAGYDEQEIQLDDYQNAGSFTQFSNCLTFNPCETVGQVYTISLWAKSPNGSTPLSIYNQNSLPRHFYFPRTTLTDSLGDEWEHFSVTIENVDMGETYSDDYCNRLEIYAQNQMGVLVKKIKVECGNRATDWTPAPEDVNDSIEDLQESIASLRIEDDTINATVKTLNEKYDSVTGDLESVSSDVTTLKQTSTEFQLSIKSIKENGVEKVNTTTGFTFDDSGLTIDSNTSDTKTIIDTDGMTVSTRSDGTTVLSATSEGVIATDLYARTYLIIGGRSRFENYGTNRTGCFWIG